MEQGLDQRDAAAILGVRRASYGRWERDQSRPAGRHLARIRELLNSQEGIDLAV